MTWVAYHSDLSEVAVFEAEEGHGLAVELKARRYAMEHSMDLIDLPDGAGLRETINAPSRAAREAADQARLLGPDIPAEPANHESSLLESDLAALVRETLDLQGSVRFWYSQTTTNMVKIERWTPGDRTAIAMGNDLSQALIDYRVKEAQRT